MADPISRGASISAPDPTLVERLYGGLDAVMRPVYSAIGMDERGAYQNAQRLSRGIEDILGLNATERSVRRIVRGDGTAGDYAGAALAAAPLAVKPVSLAVKRAAPKAVARMGRYLNEQMGIKHGALTAPRQSEPLRLPPSNEIGPLALAHQSDPRGALSLTRANAIGPTALPAPPERLALPYKPFEVRETRGQGIQYHGARGDLPELKEGYYNPWNIYGGIDTFYTTDALDVAKGYGRKQRAAKVFQVKPRDEYSMFDMERPLDLGEAHQLFGVGPDDFGLTPSAIEEAAVEHGGKPNLRQIMDMIREMSQGEGYSIDDVQSIFDAPIYNLQQKGYGGMRHIGGLRTGRDPHNVNIYFDAPSQLDFRDVPLDDMRADNPRFAVKRTAPSTESLAVKPKGYGRPTSSTALRDASGRVLRLGAKPAYQPPSGGHIDMIDALDDVIERGGPNTYKAAALQDRLMEAESRRWQAARERSEPRNDNTVETPYDLARRLAIEAEDDYNNFVGWGDKPAAPEPSRRQHKAWKAYMAEHDRLWEAKQRASEIYRQARDRGPDGN